MKAPFSQSFFTASKRSVCRCSRNKWRETESGEKLLEKGVWNVLFGYRVKFCK